MAVLFISDLHLEEGRPDITAQLLEFLKTEVTQDVSDLYILGDLFESWVGDDDNQPLYSEVAHALSQVTALGPACHFAHGNRDFLIGTEYAGRCGMDLLDEWTPVDIEGRRILVGHGDSLCTDDTEYMAFRSMVREPAWQEQFLSMPLSQRLAMASQAREQSQQNTAAKSMEIMDVNQSAVEQVMRKHGVTVLLHGHTHRPNIHAFTLDDEPSKRIVLGDWYDQGSVGRWDENGFSLTVLPR